MSIYNVLHVSNFTKTFHRSTYLEDEISLLVRFYIILYRSYFTKSSAEVWAINISIVSAEGVSSEYLKQRKVMAYSYNIYVAKKGVTEAGKEIKIK